jgi:hypothetical protein
MSTEVVPAFGQIWAAEFVSSSSRLPYVPSGTEVILLKQMDNLGWWLAGHLDENRQGQIEQVWTGFSFHERLVYRHDAPAETQALWRWAVE